MVNKLKKIEGEIWLYLCNFYEYLKKMDYTVADLEHVFKKAYLYFFYSMNLPVIFYNFESGAKKG